MWHRTMAFINLTNININQIQTFVDFGYHRGDKMLYELDLLIPGID